MSLTRSSIADALAASSVAPTYVPQLFSYNGHTASFFGLVKLPLRIMGGMRERVALGDGGSVMLHWWSVHRSPCRMDAPVVLIIHGINNTSDTPYMQYLASSLEEKGFVACAVNMRGHGRGNTICSGRLYTARADDDLQLVCEPHSAHAGAPTALRDWVLDGSQPASLLPWQPTLSRTR